MMGASSGPSSQMEAIFITRQPSRALEYLPAHVLAFLQLHQKRPLNLPFADRLSQGLPVMGQDVGRLLHPC